MTLRTKFIVFTRDDVQHQLAESMLSCYQGQKPHRMYLIDSGPNYRSIDIFRNFTYSNPQSTYLAINKDNRNWARLFIEPEDLILFLEAGWVSSANRVEQTVSHYESTKKRFITSNYVADGKLHNHLNVSALAIHGSGANSFQCNTPDQIKHMYEQLKNDHCHIPEELSRCL